MKARPPSIWVAVSVPGTKLSRAVGLFSWFWISGPSRVLGCCLFLSLSLSLSASPQLVPLSLSSAHLRESSLAEKCVHRQVPEPVHRPASNPGPGGRCKGARPRPGGSPAFSTPGPGLETKFSPGGLGCFGSPGRWRWFPAGQERGQGLAGLCGDLPHPPSRSANPAHTAARTCTRSLPPPLAAGVRVRPGAQRSDQWPPQRLGRWSRWVLSGWGGARTQRSRGRRGAGRARGRGSEAEPRGLPCSPSDAPRPHVHARALRAPARDPQARSARARPRGPSEAAEPAGGAGCPSRARRASPGSR